MNQNVTVTTEYAKLGPAWSASTVKVCPRCGSPRHCEPYRTRSPNGGMGNLCRHAWHMPALTVEAEEALEFVKAVDRQFSGEISVNIPGDR